MCEKHRMFVLKTFLKQEDKHSFADFPFLGGCKVGINLSSSAAVIVSCSFPLNPNFFLFHGKRPSEFLKFTSAGNGIR